MPRRIDLGRAVLFAGAALLFISLFLKWYDTGPTGWQVFESLDLALAALAAAGVFAALRPDGTAPWAAAAVPIAAVAIVAVQIVGPPPAAGDGGPASGAWLALAGALLMSAGAALSLAAISVMIQVRERDVRRRVAAIDRRGAPGDDLAEDLDADAAGPVASRIPSLFGGLAGRDDADVDQTGEPPLRTGRFTPREAAGEEEAAATAHRAADAARTSGPAGAPAPAPASRPAGDLERTQPLTGLPDEERTERP
jgi:hypothetical protein